MHCVITEISSTQQHLERRKASNVLAAYRQVISTLYYSTTEKIFIRTNKTKQNLMIYFV